MTDPIVTMQTPNLYGPAQSFGLTNRYDYKGLDPELALAERAADQRQLIANAILNQSSVPRRGKMVGRLYQKAHWAEGLGQLGEAAAGMYLSNKIQSDRADAEKKSTDRVTDAITKFNSATQDEPARTITHAAQPAQPGNFEQVMSQQPSPSEVTPLRSVDDFSRQSPAPALTGQYQRATPNVPYEMGSLAQPERTEVSPGAPVDERSRQAAMAQLAMSPHPQVKEFYQNQLTLAKEARAQQQMDARDAEHTRQFGVTSGISQQIQDLAQRREKEDQERYAREAYDKKTQGEAANFEKGLERLSREKMAEENNINAMKIAHIRANDLPRNMELGPDGTPRAVENSPLYMKEAAAVTTDRRAIRAAQDEALSMSSTIDRMLSEGNKNAFEANFGRLPSVTRAVASWGDSKVNDMENDLKTVLDTAAGMGLASLKAKTGVSPGSITEREWPMLQSMSTSLKATSSPSEARRILGEMKELIRYGAEARRQDHADLHTDSRHEKESGPVPSLAQYEQQRKDLVNRVIVMQRGQHGLERKP